jgi:hypothetical protein
MSIGLLSLMLLGAVIVVDTAEPRNSPTAHSVLPWAADAMNPRLLEILTLPSKQPNRGPAEGPAFEDDDCDEEGLHKPRMCECTAYLMSRGCDSTGLVHRRRQFELVASYRTNQLLIYTLCTLLI